MLTRIIIAICFPGYLFAQEVTRESAAEKIRLWREQLSAMAAGLKVLTKAVSEKFAQDLPAKINDAEKRIRETKEAIEKLDQELREKDFLPPEGVREYFQEVSKPRPSDKCDPARRSP